MVNVEHAARLSVTMPTGLGWFLSNTFCGSVGFMPQLELDDCRTLYKIMLYISGVITGRLSVSMAYMSASSTQMTFRRGSRYSTVVA